MKKTFFFLFIILFAFSIGCTKDNDNPKADPGYDYYPGKEGSFIIYNVDSIHHDQPDPAIEGIHDTVSYQVKEWIAETFTDDAGRPALRIHRFKRGTEHDEWQLSDVWVSVKTNVRVEKVEENQRFIRLAFPINEFTSWDGNALNSLPEWIHTYENPGLPFEINGLNFDASVKVIQRDISNQVRQENAVEIYAENVGLIFKSIVLLDTHVGYLINPSANFIRLGTEYKLEVIDYGEE